MYAFEIIPDDDSSQAVKLFAVDNAEILATAKRLDCFRADVLRNGEHIFSVKRLGRKGDFWGIFPRASYSAIRE